MMKLHTRIQIKRTKRLLHAGVQAQETAVKRMLLPQSLVASLLSGATQVSVPVKPQPSGIADFVVNGCTSSTLQNAWWWKELKCGGDEQLIATLLEHCPFPVGTAVWVPETWMPDGADCRFGMMQRGEIPPDIVYKHDSPHYGKYFKWRPSSTMPSDFARLRYIVEGVKVGRVWDVTEEEAMAHGMAKLSASNYLYSWDATRDRGYDTAHTAYSVVWNAAYPDYPWDSNPWRYTYTVRRL